MKKFFIVLVATALVVAFTLPASAATEFNFYGSVHMDTLVTDTDDPDPLVRDTSPLTWDLSTGNWSSFGANWRVDENLSGQVEWRSGPGEAYIPIAVGGSEMKPYSWTGTYNFGFATLRLGRWWAPSFNPPPAWMVDTVGNAIVTVQEPRIALENIMVGPVKFQITGMQAGETAITQMLNAAGNVVASPIWGGAVTEQKMPKLEARADVKFGPVAFVAMGGYYSYDMYSNASNTALSKSVDSNFWGAIATLNYGPFAFRASWISISNPGPYGAGAGAGNGVITNVFDPADNDIIDVDRDIWQAYATYTLNPMISFNLIYGHQKDKLSGGGVDAEDPTSGWTFTVPINITQNFTVRLEYSKKDYEDFTVDNVSTDEGDVTKYGVRWIFFF